MVTSLDGIIQTSLSERVESGWEFRLAINANIKTARTNNSRFYSGLENIFWFSKGNYRSSAKYNTKGKLKSSVVRMLKFRGTCD